METADNIVIRKINEVLEKNLKSKDLMIRLLLVFLKIIKDPNYLSVHGLIDNAMFEKAVLDAEMGESVCYLNSFMNRCFLFPSLSGEEAEKIREYVNQLMPAIEGTFRKHMENYFKTKSELMCIEIMNDYITGWHWAVDYALNGDSENVFMLEVKGVEDYRELYEKIIDSIVAYYEKKGFNFMESDVYGGGVGYGYINLRGVSRSESKGNEVRCINIKYTNEVIIITSKEY